MLRIVLENVCTLFTLSNNVFLLRQAVERKAKRFRDLVIPNDLQRQLPFKDKPKVKKFKRDEVQAGRIAVVRSKKEKQVRSWHHLTTLCVSNTLYRYVCTLWYITIMHILIDRSMDDINV